jgi:uncharacterized protein (TIGR01244 family)
MKRLILLVAVFSFTSQSLAENSGADAIVLVSIDEIRAGKGDLSAKKTVSAGQPDVAVLSTFAAAGYVAVIDLRTDKEDRGFNEPVTIMGLGMSYVSMPIGSETDINFEKAAELDKILSGFDGPVLVHCASGNRVGALFALREKANGATNEEALAAGKTAGMTGLEPVVSKVLQTIQE